MNSGDLRMLYRNSNSPRYLGKCLAETWIWVPEIDRFSCDQKPSRVLV